MDFSFTNSFSVFGFSLIKGALIGFPTGLVLVILLGRFGLWRRKNRTHAILVKLYYLYIPLVFAAFFSGWFGISNIRDQADHTMAELRPTVTELSLSVADALLDDIQAGRNVKEISVKDVITLTKIYVSREVDQRITVLPGYAQKMVRPLQSMIPGMIEEAIASKIQNEAKDRLYLDKATLVRLWEGGLEDALRHGLVMDTLEEMFRQKYHFLWQYLLLGGLLFMLPVILETGISHYLARRSQRQARPAAVTPSRRL